MKAPVRLLCFACLRSVEWTADPSSATVTPQSCPTCGGALSDGCETPPHELGSPTEIGGRVGGEDHWRQTWASGSLGRIDRFQLRDVLGGGGHGDVYRAYDPRLDRDVALKVLKGNNLGARAMERFFREARAAARLEHPLIVSVFDAGQEDGRCWIAYQFISGRTLSRYRDVNALDARASAKIIRDLADALDHAHERGMTHRDLKPANVIMDPQGRPHLTDFGLARRLDFDSDLTCEGAILGTPAYMSPEQAAGNSDRADARSDVYSLGVVFYELLCGRRPVDVPSSTPPWRLERNSSAPPPRSLDRNIAPELDRICRKALADDPSDRYPDARAMVVDLDRWLSRRRRPSRLGPTAIACVLAVLLISTVALAVPRNFGRPPEGQLAPPVSHTALKPPRLTDEVAPRTALAPSAPTAVAATPPTPAAPKPKGVGKTRSAWLYPQAGQVYVYTTKDHQKYHYPDCANARNIAENSVAWFSSDEEAQKAGRVLCSLCKRHPGQPQADPDSP